MCCWQLDLGGDAVGGDSCTDVIIVGKDIAGGQFVIAMLVVEL